MKSHGWKPVVYVTASLGGVAVALTLAYLLVLLVEPKFTLVGLRKTEGKVTLAAMAGIAYGAVVATTWLLKRYFGREFGTYLDDADSEVEGPRPALEKRCSRCGTVFGVFQNDFHAAGFCSRACREAFTKSRGTAK